MDQMDNVKDDLKLVFGVDIFNAPNFNVERFLDRARHSASLDDIHHDLRIFLQDIQSKMVTLINDDYTDFVKLSTSLHALNDAKQGLANAQEIAWGDYNKSTVDTEKLVSYVSQKLDEVLKSRQQQFRLSLQLARATAIKNLNDDLKQRPKFAELFWLQKVREHVAILRASLFLSTNMECSSSVANYSKVLFENLKRHLRPYLEFQNSSSMKAKLLVLDVLIDVEAVGDAADFVTKTICQIPEFEGKADARMKFWLNDIKKKHSEIAMMVDSSELSESGKAKLQKFYNNCLLSCLTTVFAEKIRPILLPINPTMFKNCFEMMTNFVDEFPERLVYLNFWKTWVEDFPISAYIRFHSLSAVEKFRESMKMENLKVIYSENGPAFETSVAFLDVVKILLDGNVVLTNTRHFFWVEVFKQLTDFMDWTENLKSYLLSAPEILSDGTQKWLALVVAGKTLYQCLNNFSKLGHHFFTIFAPKSNHAEINLLSENFDNCCSFCEEQLRRHCDILEISLNTSVLEVLSKEMSTVLEVPKVYRWTKHPSPTESSNYVTKVADILTEVNQKALEVGWNFDVIQEILNNALERSLKVYHVKASEVLDSVEQIGSSLLRLKKKQTADSGTNETDEGKMKKQIALDTKSFLELTKDGEVFKEVYEMLEKLLTRAEKDL